MSSMARLGSGSSAPRIALLQVCGVGQGQRYTWLSRQVFRWELRVQLRMATPLHI